MIAGISDRQTIGKQFIQAMPGSSKQKLYAGWATVFPTQGKEGTPDGKRAAAKAVSPQGRSFFRKAQTLFSNQGDDPGCPHPADGPHDEHGGDHIGDRKVLDFGDAKAGGQQDQPAAGFEIVNHGRGGEGEDDPRKQEQQKEDHKLRNGDGGYHHAQGAGEDHGGEQIQNRLCKQDAVVAADARHDGAVNA